MIQIEKVNDGCDIKAEVMVADLIERGYDSSQVAIIPMGAFSRRYRKDVVNLISQESATGPLHILKVSRDGIYDHLPQGLFHQAERIKAKTFEEKIDELKRQRIEEEECRKVFSVLEREFNYCRVMVEMEERNSILGLSEDAHSDLFLEVWPEIKNIDTQYHKFLFQILPLAHVCRNNPEFSAALFTYVLDAPVEVSVSHEPYMKAADTEVGKSYGMSLGINTILGRSIPVYEQLFTICVREVSVEKLHTFLEGGHAHRVIHFLLEYFLPFDADFDLKIVVKKADEKLILKAENNCSFLSYNSTI